MILVTERFFVAKEHWAAFEAQCRTLAAIMAGRSGFYHQCLVRGCGEFPSHIRYSAWESLERFREWTRSDAFVLAASGTVSPSFIAPKQMEVQLVPTGTPAAPRPADRLLPIQPEQLTNQETRGTL
ncbi:MAG: antibiotic biosynthesis monooxygenase [Betaproteobacteria bacterium]|nr:antibiotic biosynthesis monooxygenase [Betaproteobacteria bacterium]